MTIKRITGFFQNRVLGNLVLTFGTSTALQGIAILTGILTARLLGPTGKGQLTAVVLWAAILASIGSLGIAEAINYFTASGDNPKRKILATGVYLGSLQVALLLIIGWLLTPLVLERQGEEMVKLGSFYLIFIPLNVFTLYHMAYLGGSLRFGAYNLVRFLVSGTILVGLIFLAVFGWVTVVNVAIVYLVANTIALAVSVSHVYRPVSTKISPDRRLAGSMLAYGLKAHTSQVTLMVNERLDQLLIAMLMPAAQLGYYAVAVSLTSGVLMIGTSIAIVAMPVVAKEKSREAQVKHITRFYRMNLWLSIAVAGCFIFAAHYLILLLFGPAYLPSESAARILLLAAVPLSGNQVLQASLKAINQPLQAGLAELIAAILTVALLIVFLPLLGIVGAALTSLLAYMIASIYMVWVVRLKLNCSVGDLIFLRISDIEYVGMILGGRFSRNKSRVNTQI